MFKLIFVVIIIVVVTFFMRYKFLETDISIPSKDYGMMDEASLLVFNSNGQKYYKVDSDNVLYFANKNIKFINVIITVYNNNIVSCEFKSKSAIFLYSKDLIVFDGKVNIKLTHMKQSILVLASSVYFNLKDKVISSSKPIKIKQNNMHINANALKVNIDSKTVRFYKGVVSKHKVLSRFIYN